MVGVVISGAPLRAQLGQALRDFFPPGGHSSSKPHFLA